MEYSLQVKELTKMYPNFKLDKVSFSIPCGTIMGFVGENGSGKTTTINSILNLIKKDSGVIKIFGQYMLDNNINVRNDIGVIFDSTNFHEGLTVKQVTSVMRKIYRSWDQEFFLKMTKNFKIPINKKIKTFSKGMIMKLSILTVLSYKPKLLILDEATSGLDPITRDEVLNIFLQFIKDGKCSILMSSHITSDLEKVADYITFIHQGKIILTDKKDNLKYKYGIVSCSKKQFININKDNILAYKEKDSKIDILVKDKDSFQTKYENIDICNVSIEEILLLISKGEKILW